MSVNLRALIARLNDESRRALESAAGLCLSRTHYDVEIEHYLMKALDDTAGDIAAILKHFGVDRSRLASELTRSLDKLKTGNARNPSFSSASLISPVSTASTSSKLSNSTTTVRPRGKASRVRGRRSPRDRRAESFSTRRAENERL